MCGVSHSSHFYNLIKNIRVPVVFPKKNWKMPYLITHPKSLITFIEVPKGDFQKHVIKIRIHKSVNAYLSKENLYHMIHGVFKTFFFFDS